MDARGNPRKFLLTSGAAGDNPQALPLLVGIQAGEVVADRGDDADKTLASSEQAMRAIATIPPKQRRGAPRDCDATAYNERQRVECRIGKLKHFRRSATRYDQYAHRFLAVLQLVGALIWLK